jgi:t-SNARE complex subunit (syntaxin)
MEPNFNHNLHEKHPQEWDKTEKLTKLSKDVIELNEIFSMVNDMVVDQQESIGMLQEAIVDATEQHKQAQVELQQATDLQKKVDKKKTLLTGAGIIATSVALSTVVGIGISIPLTLGGFCCYKIANYQR